MSNTQSLAKFRVEEGVRAQDWRFLTEFRKLEKSNIEIYEKESGYLMFVTDVF